jgi:hypothetical protein
MKRILQILIALAVVLVIAGGLVWGFFAARSAQTAEAAGEAPIEAPSRVTQEAGKTVLAFDPQQQHANGIAVTALVAERRSAAAQATGVVLQLQPILDLKTSYSAAQMEITKARAASQASQAEYKRLLGLNKSEENVSQKSLEGAQAAAESDAATLQNAQQSLGVLMDSMELHWGTAIARWVEQGSPQLDALAAERIYLLQVTAIDGSSAAPASVIVQMPDSAHSPARLISALPQLDPRLQAPSFLYTISAHVGLVPGINLSVSLPAGPPENGVIVPHSAVVWWQGQAWGYVEESPGKFTREEVATGNPTPTGWFVTEGIAPGARVVTTGAQTLLSTEFRSQIQSDED